MEVNLLILGCLQVPSLIFHLGSFLFLICFSQFLFGHLTSRYFFSVLLHGIDDSFEVLSGYCSGLPLYHLSLRLRK